MSKYLRITGLCFSLLVFLGLLVYLPTGAVAGVGCPCNLDSVPRTTACWVDPFSQQPTFQILEPMMNDCSIDNFIDGTVTSIGVGIRQEGVMVCNRIVDTPEVCGGVSTLFLADLTPEEFEACICELQTYADALDRVQGIDIVGLNTTGPPWICSASIDCPSPPQIPTLNQWGKIITIAVIGLFAAISIFAMQRRNVTN